MLIDFSVGCLNRRWCLLQFPCTLWLGFRPSARMHLPITCAPLSVVPPLRMTVWLPLSPIWVCRWVWLSSSPRPLPRLPPTLMPKFALLPNYATTLHRKPAVGFTAGMNAAVATVVTKARLGFHNGRSGMMNRKSNEGGGIRQFMGNFVIVST